MNNIIFLDIDGVLNSNFWNETHQREISDGTLIDRDKIQILAEFIHKTDAKLVLHSGWRFWFDSDLKPLRAEAAVLTELLGECGLEISDVTPDYTTEEIRKTKKFSLVKAKEILGWLELHREVDQWIVIDDLDLQNEEILRHQIKPDPTVGLTRQDMMRVKLEENSTAEIFSVVQKEETCKNSGHSIG